ncbi:MAG TPA: phosphonoacetate hydrolase [Hyphomicrobiaceae bacterium]|nr:phosphonoacetate hydrolase [Hyphomicrobiaceae bacterium]
MATVEVNGRTYRTPERPTVVICFDGCDPAYIERGIKDGILPTIAKFRETGFFGSAEAVVPTFTNPNNASIVTGVPPAVHGISGNYYLDRATGEERMITDAALMRSSTILAGMAKAGVKTAAVTAKDKLRLMLARGLEGIAFSSEKADKVTMADNGITDVEQMVGRGKPDQYSADLSIYVLDAGLRLLERDRAQLLYLSLSDFVQHAHAPGEPEANAFNRAVDERVAQLMAAGAVVGVVADHGMNDKSRADGSANVVFLEEELNRRFGDGAVRVICPITDPFVRHHGALGSFVRVYMRKSTDLAALMVASQALPGVEAVVEGKEAAKRYGLPLDLEGDFVVLGDASTVVGASRSEHDLSGLAGHRLRSHGGLGEQKVPFLVSRPLRADYLAQAGKPLRNFDIFHAVLNGVA